MAGVKIYFKPGVQVNGATHWLFEGLSRAASALGGYGPVTVTSVLDGKHMEGSLHYEGRAADLRSKHIPLNLLDEALSHLKASLGPDWDVIVERRGHRGPSGNEHFHIEFQPRGTRASVLL